MSSLTLDAQALYKDLLASIVNIYRPEYQLVGVTSGGVWLAEKLHKDLNISSPINVISSSMHRDDFAHRGMMASMQTKINFDVNEAHIILVDDVLYTGRTIRAVINELYDFGRPASVKLAVMVDRGGRELPVQADICATKVTLASHLNLDLIQGDDGVFSFNVEER